VSPQKTPTHKPLKAKGYKAKRRKMLSMKIDNLVIGLLVLMFAAILLGDAMLVTYTSTGETLSPNDVKGITGFVFVIIAVLIFLKARDKAKG